MKYILRDVQTFHPRIWASFKHPSSHGPNKTTSLKNKCFISFGTTSLHVCCEWNIKIEIKTRTTSLTCNYFFHQNQIHRKIISENFFIIRLNRKVKLLSPCACFDNFWKDFRHISSCFLEFLFCFCKWVCCGISSEVASSHINVEQ